MSTQPELKRLPLAFIQPDPTQSRTSFDPVKLAALKESLDQHGQLFPILVHQRGKDRYEIIAGERRYRAAALLKWKDIQCLVYPKETKRLDTEVLSLVENVQRVDLNPIEEAKGYQQLAKQYRLHKTAIAELVGKDRPYISRMLDLLSLPTEIQKSVSQDTLSVTHIRFLTRITNVKRQIALAKQAEAEGWTVRQTEQKVNEELSHRPAGAHSSAPSHPTDGADPAAQTAPPEPEDEMAVLMTQAAAVYLVKPDAWAFRYGGAGKYRFEVDLQGKDRLSKLAQWAGELGKALGYRDPDTEPAPYDPQKWKDDLAISPDQLPAVLEFLQSNATDAEKAAYMKKMQEKNKE